MVAAAAGGLLAGSAWVATQRGLVPRQVGAAASVAFVVLDGLLVLVPLWLAAAGLGYPLRRASFHAMPGAGVAQAGVGMAVLMVVAWCWAAVAGVSPWAWWVVGGVGWLLLLLQLTIAARAKRAVEWPWCWTWALPAMPLGLLLVGACCPPGTVWGVEAYGYDVMSYHLQLPREWLAGGRLTGLTHNVYSFLPGLVEGTYLWLAAMRGSAVEAIHVAQLFHVSLGVYAAVAIGCLVARAAGARAGAAACAVALALPWTVVTGSLAYNEMAMLAFAAAAVLVVCDPVSERWPGAATAGLLLGASIFAKPTAGFMVALPVAVGVLARLNHVLPWRSPPSFARRAWVLVIVVLAAAVLQLPWLIRNGVATGNPLFPFACDVLGSGHWDDAHVQRWSAAHGLTASAGVAERGEALLHQWLLNAGYGAIGGSPQTRTATNMAVFDSGPGFPLLWAYAGLGLVLGWRTRQTRGLAWAMAAMLAVQLVAWLAVTHLQSRFAVATILPGAVLAGLALGRLDAVLSPRRWWLAPSLTIFLVLSLTASGFNEFVAQVRPGLDPWDVIDSLGRGVADHPLDELPAGSRVMMVGDAGGLLYVDVPVVYATAFDASPVVGVGGVSGVGGTSGGGGTAGGVRDDASVGGGVTHVWVSWSELARLHETYGHDVTADEVRRLAASWRVVRDYGHATLYEVPR